MSLCLLATTGLLGQESLLKPEYSKWQPESTINSTSAKFDNSVSAPPKTVPTVESPTLEFSERSPQPLSQCLSSVSPDVSNENRISLQQTKVYKTTSKATKFSQTATQYPTSGTQLYQQRMLALKSFQKYKQLSCDRLFLSQEIIDQKPTYQQWKYLLEQEAKTVAQFQGMNRLVVLVGDSLTLWLPPDQLPSRSLWLNQGISGDNSRGILKRLSAFSQTRPDRIYVLAGINDLRQGATNKVIINNIYQIIRRLRQNHPQAEVVMQSILPTRLAAIPAQRIHYLNRTIAIMAERLGASYLDLHSLFVDSKGNLRFDLTTDGLHLNRRGYQVWQSALLRRESYQLARSLEKQQSGKKLEKQPQIRKVSYPTNYCRVNHI